MMVRQGTYLVPTLLNMRVRLEMAGEPGALTPYNIQKAAEIAPLQQAALARARRRAPHRGRHGLAGAAPGGTPARSASW